MSEKFWLEIAVCALAVIVAVGVMKTKTDGWGPRSMQALIVSIGVPTLIILGLEQILNSQAVAAILGAVVGFGAGKALKE